MPAVLDRLQSLRVADVMNRRVVPVSAHQTMSEAAAIFLEHGISGAPVVDEEGRCVGILSAADFVRREIASQGADPSKPKGGPAATAASRVAKPDSESVLRQSPGGWEISDVRPEEVAAHMTPAVQSVTPEMPLVDAARMMCTQHIHRLPVLDAEAHPQGMVTALDIVAAVVQAVEERRLS